MERIVEGKGAADTARHASWTSTLPAPEMRASVRLRLSVQHENFKGRSQLNDNNSPNGQGRIMRTKVKRFVAALVFVTVALAPAAAMAASSYWSTLDYTVHLTGSTRSYTGADVKISLTSVESFHFPGNNTHRIKLYRDNPWWQGDDYIGLTDVPRSGASGVRTWSSVGNGSYYFDFSKANDGVRITSSNVHMFSQ
jgi:hypothetical protein